MSTFPASAVVALEPNKTLVKAGSSPHLQQFVHLKNLFSAFWDASRNGTKLQLAPYDESFQIFEFENSAWRATITNQDYSFPGSTHSGRQPQLRFPGDVCVSSVTLGREERQHYYPC